MELSDYTFEVFNNYFNVLKNIGYKKNSDSNKLLILGFIEDLLTGPYRIYITDEDYKYIEAALNCLFGSSRLISFPRYPNDDTLYHESNRLIIPKDTEDSNIRIVADEDNIRLQSTIDT